MTVSATQHAVQSPAIYTCLMHPHIRQAAPGTCSICGMALETESATASMLRSLAASTSTLKPLAIGTLATLAMLGVYFSVLTLVSGWDFTVSEFSRFWYYVLPLALGFGIQMGLYVYLRQRLAHHHTGGKMVVASGATSTGAMLACCTHYLANILPVIGAAGAVTLVAQYQVELFWVGLAFNLAGIIFIGSRIFGAGRPS
jgi:Cu+-exporting ATPase